MLKGDSEKLQIVRFALPGLGECSRGTRRAHVIMLVDLQFNPVQL